MTLTAEAAEPAEKKTPPNALEELGNEVGSRFPFLPWLATVLGELGELGGKTS